MRNPVAHRPAFTVGERACTWGDVVEWADRRGLLSAVDREVAEGVACLSERRQGGAPWEHDVRQAANEFRRERRLLSAEETEAWLARWSLTVGEWMDYVRRSLARQQLGDEVGTIVERHPPDGSQVSARLWPTAVCSGAVEGFARELAVRLAAHAALGGETVRPTDAEADAAHRRFAERATSTEALRRVLEARLLDWMRIDYELVEFASEEAAREGLLCIRDDGMPVADVAAQAAATLRPETRLLVDSPAALQPLLLAASLGEAIGPVPEGDGYALLVVARKTAGSLDDAEVRSRSAQVALGAAVERLVAEHVRWHDT